MNNLPEPKQDFLIFKGGLDETTPVWQIPPGFVRESQNYEIAVTGGYQDLNGYERYSGVPEQPSLATYQIVPYTGISNGPFPAGYGISAIGLTSGSITNILADGGDHLALVYPTSVGPGFIAGEVIGALPNTFATTTGVGVENGAPTTELHALYTALAADQQRVLINPVGGGLGTGPVLGTWVLNDVVYAVRESFNVPGTALLFKEIPTGAGWTTVSLGESIHFTSGGVYVMAVGDTITGATSGTTAVLTAVQLESGSFAGGDAAGYLYFATQLANFTLAGENLNVGANLNVATVATGGSIEQTLLSGGRYETFISNLEGALSSQRVYGCDGVNPGFEFDGTTWVKIHTGMATDTPDHVVVHKLHLFFSFGPSVQHSGIATPYIWSPVLGAAELNAGDDVTAFQIEPGSTTGGALGVYCRNSLKMLYGNSASDWNFVSFLQQGVGAYAYTVQQVGFTLFLDDRGVNTLRTAQEFGNFTSATLSQKVQRFLQAHRGLAVASIRSHDKSQYQVYFSDGYALFATIINGKIAGFMPVLLPDVVTCTWSGELSDGSEVIFFGAESGYLMKMETGTSFDGVEIEAFMRFPPHFLKSNGYEKRLIGATAEVAGTARDGFGFSSFDYGYELNYNDAETAQPATLEASWDSANNVPVHLDVKGTAESIAYTIERASNAFEQVLFTGIRTSYLLRRRVRHR